MSSPEKFDSKNDQEVPVDSSDDEVELEGTDHEHEPDLIVALSMLDLAFKQHPDALERSMRPGAVVIITVPNGWEHRVAAVWNAQVNGVVKNYVASSRAFMSRLRGIPADGRKPYVVIDQMEGRTGRRTGIKLNANARDAIRSGRGLNAFVEDVVDCPAPLRGSADLVVKVPHPSSFGLRDAATAVGVGAGYLIAEHDASNLMPEHLTTALRPEQTADEYLKRVERLLAAERPSKSGNAAVPSGPGLDDLFGMDEARAWGLGLARDLKAYAAGQLPWADVDRGALLAGPPGTGKTTFAKRLASQCGVRLIATSYSEWQSAGKEGHSGEVMKCLRETFARARAAAPCILFIDELDAIGARHSGNKHNDDWWSMIVGGLLGELDGIDGREGVVVVGASNFAEKVDPAIVRSGRLDRTIQIRLPNRAALEGILKGCLGTALSESEIARVAKYGLGSSGADVDRWCRGARRRARHASREILVSDVLAELTEGTEGRSQEYRRLLAIHECGHALAFSVRRPDSVTSVSLLPSGSYAEAKVSGEMLKESAASIASLQGTMVELLAGRAAEEVVLGEVTGGAVADLERSTRIATLIDVSFGMGPKLWSLGLPDKNEITMILLSRPDVSDRVDEMMRAAYTEALALIRTHRSVLDALVDALLASEVLDGAEVTTIIAAASTSPPSRTLGNPQSPVPEAPMDGMR